MSLKTQKDVIKTENGNTYHIISELSRGNRTVIYRAKCQVGEKGSYNVLLKEFLIPDDVEAQLYDYEEYINHELEMNRWIIESAFPGALTIEYAEYGKEDGTIYGVMTNLRSGMTLQEYVKSPQFKYTTLRDRIAIVRRIAVVINNFHKECKMIHGDISPNNIYMIETGSERTGEYNQAVSLLDFETTRFYKDESELPVFATEGYAMRDIIEGRRTCLEEKDDWFGLVCCLWYCLSGYTDYEYSLTYEHIEEIVKEIPAVYERNAFAGENEEAYEFIQKEIKDYQEILEAIINIFYEKSSLSEMFIEKLDEVLGLLDDRWISKGKIYSNLKSEYQNLRSKRFSSLKILQNILPDVELDLPESTSWVIRSNKDRPETLNQVFYNSRESLFMIGDGGMGKTTSLIGIMDEAYGVESEAYVLQKAVSKERNPVVFLELCVLSQDFRDWYDEKQGATFIEQFIASYLTGQPRRFLDKKHPYVTAIQEELFRMPKTGEKEYTVLLDGMNEISFINDRSKMVFYNALNEYLKYARNLRLIITGRNDVYELSPEHLLRLKALGLEDNNIIDILRKAVEKGTISEVDFQNLKENRENMARNESRLWKCLRIPFFLIMYCMSSNKKNVESQGEILRNFFHDKREILNDDSFYGEQSQTQIRHRGKLYAGETKLSVEYAMKAALDFLIPEIAISMAEQNSFFITRQEMLMVMRRYFERVERMEEYQGWMNWYYVYNQNIKAIIHEIKRIDRGRKIPEYACKNLGIMRETANGRYFFVHQYFRDYFAACALINRILGAIEEREYIRDTMDVSSEEFASYVYPLHDLEMSDYICALVGEILGERKNIPVYDSHNKRWIEQEKLSKEQGVLMNFLDGYRNIREKNEKVETGLKNVISILKKSRIRNDGNIDFSNIDFSGLDVSQLALKGIIFSHMDREGNIYKADFRHTTGILDAILKDETEQKVVCCGIHPTKRKILILNEQTNMLTELDLENGESHFQVRVSPGYIYAWYVGAQEDILIVRTSMEQSYDEEDDDLISWLKKEPQKEDMEIRYYSRNRNNGEDRCDKAVITDIKRCLGVSYSESYRQLSIFVVRQNQIELLIEKIPEHNYREDYNINQFKIFTLPVEKKDVRYIERSTFMFVRLDKTNYLIGDSNVWKWNIGKWNIAENEVKTIFYRDAERTEKGFRAVCCGRERELLYLSTGEKTDIQRIDEIRDMDMYSNWSMHAENKEELVILNERNLLLRLYEGTLTAYNMENRNEMWICNSLFITQIYPGKAILIANADDGIYEIDSTDGSYRCLHQYQKERTDFLIGRTTNSKDVLLYESTGIVKWIDIHTRSCFRQTALQCMGRDQNLEDIFYDDKREYIYGITGRKVYSWEGWSGELKNVLRLDCDKNCRIYNTEFDFATKTLVVYYEREDYQKFPLQKRYFIKIWSFKKGGWLSSQEEKKAMFRRIRGDKRNVIAIEINEILNYKGPRMWQKPDDKKKNIVWKTKYSMERDQKKVIFMSMGNGWKRVASVDGDKQVIGITEKGVLYTVERDEEKADLKLFWPGQEELIRFEKLFDVTFTKAMVIGDIFVGLARKGPVRSYKEKLYIWNVDDDQLQEHDIAEKVYTVGCPVNMGYLEDREINMASMEGMIEPQKSQGIAVKRIEKKSLIEARNVKERMRQWNYPAVICAILLIGIDYIRRIFMCGGELDVKKDILQIAAAQIGMLTVTGFVKWAYPELICKMQGKKLKKLEAQIALSLIAAGLPFMVDFFVNLEFGEIISINSSIVMILCVPVIWMCFSECPIEKRWALYVGYIHSCVWIFLILTEVPLYSLTRIELILWIILSEIYVLGKGRIYTMEKYQFIITLMELGGITILACAIVGYVARSKGIIWSVNSAMKSFTAWSECFERARDNIGKYHFLGPLTNPWRADYLGGAWAKEFPVTYIMEQKGFLVGIVIMAIGIALVYFLWKGTWKQDIVIDRCVCMSCTIYITLETIVALLTVVGIGYTCPGKLPFIGENIDELSINWMIFGIYMTFYKAHRRKIQ